MDSGAVQPQEKAKKIALPDEIDFVLEDDDVLEAHDLHSSQML